jgi:uncharacterized protein YeaO (DUF488 family)
MPITEARTTLVRTMTLQEQAQLGLRVLVMRKWPQGFARSNIDIWLPDAGPSLVLLEEYRSGSLSWDDFALRYLDEQDTQKTCRVVRYKDGKKGRETPMHCSPLDLLHQWSKNYKVTVMCWENDEVKCHRHLLVEYCRSKETV